MTKIKGILVDPEKQTIEEVEIEKGLENIYEILGCRMIEGIYNFPETIGYVDEEGLLKEGPLRVFDIEDTDYSNTISGKCLYLGVDDDGDSADCEITVEEVKAVVAFRDTPVYSSLVNRF